MNIEQYSKIAPQYFTDDAPRLIIEILKKNNFSRILDCGCGDGSLLYYIKKHNLSKEAKVLGVDLSRNRVDIAKKISKKFVVQVDSVETLKTIKNSSIDFLISEQVIEHVDDKKMVEAISRVCQTGAVVYISTVYKKWYGWYFYKNKIGWVLDPTHLREYTSDSQLLDLFKDKFVVIKNLKSLQWFPIVDFFAKRLVKLNRNRDTLLWKIIRTIRVPIIGYYIWEIQLKKI